MPDYKKQPEELGFVYETGLGCMSIFIDPLYSPSEEEKVRDNAQLLVTGRRKWHTLRGTGEAVWPPYLEAALLAGLEEYKAGKTTSGRLPQQNKYISDHIMKTTGRRRSEKQVGSRIQYLRMTCKNEMMCRLASQRTTSKRLKSQRTTSQRLKSQRKTPKESSIYVEIDLQNDLWLSPTPFIDLFKMGLTTPQSIQLRQLASPTQEQLLGSVQFLSPFALIPRSTFSVYAKEFSGPVHTEAVPLKCTSSPTQSNGPGWLYNSDLVPGFWEKLCSSQDARQYTILQLLEEMNSDHTQTGDNSLSKISLIYTFLSTPAQHSRASSTLNTPPAHSPMSALSTLTPDSDSRLLQVPSPFSSPQQPCGGIPTFGGANTVYDNMVECSQLGLETHDHINSDSTLAFEPFLNLDLLFS